MGRKLEPAAAFRDVKKTGYDVVHFHGDDYLCAGSRRRVRTFYGSALDEALHARTAGRFVYQGLFHLFEWISCVRKGMLVGISRSTCRSLPLVKEVIPCGVPLNRFAPGGAKSPEPSLLFVGDLDSRKRGRFLVRTFLTDIAPRIPTCTLGIVGPQPVRAPGVRYFGTVSEDRLVEEYRRAWACCVVSSYEGFGVPIIEAMACGCPVIAVRTDAAGECVQSGVDGILCEQAELADAAVSLLGEPARREALTAKALVSVRKYDIDKVAAAYEAVYSRLGEPRP